MYSYLRDSTLARPKNNRFQIRTLPEIDLDSRKRKHKAKSGAQTATSCCNQPSPGSIASNVLILKSMVPKNCSAQLSQPISRGFQPKTARCFEAGRSDSAG